MRFLRKYLWRLLWVYFIECVYFWTFNPFEFSVRGWFAWIGGAMIWALVDIIAEGSPDE
jgi:hypothetical protein